MNNVSEFKRRMIPAPSQAGDVSLVVKGLQKQMAQVQQLIKEQTALTRKQVQASGVQHHWLERIHDRLDAVSVESRVTNMLLAELVSIHQTVITDNTDEVREAVREEAYRRVRNAE
jgi:hypothetical protein